MDYRMVAQTGSRQDSQLVVIAPWEILHEIEQKQILLKLSIHLVEPISGGLQLRQNQC